MRLTAALSLLWSSQIIRLTPHLARERRKAGEQACEA